MVNCMKEYLFSIPFVIFGGIIIWIMIFLGTYPHFPRMEKQKRIEYSVKSATVMALAFIVLSLIAMYLLVSMIIK